MKRFFTLIVILFCIGGLQAQSVDYELMGFVDDNDELIEGVSLDASQDFSPRIKVRNNGPGVLGISDSVIFDIFYDGVHLTMMSVKGVELQDFVAGESRLISLPHPLFTAEIMDEYTMTAFNICYELRFTGNSFDPVVDNNVACLSVSRPLPVEEYTNGDFLVGPNPARDALKIKAPAGTVVGIYNMAGQQLMTFCTGDDVYSADLSDWSSGIYFVKMSKGTAEMTRKVIIAR